MFYTKSFPSRRRTTVCGGCESEEMSFGELEMTEWVFFA
jgi:hypothetical protein